MPRVIVGDCLRAMTSLEANSVDAVVTDPPYGIGFMGKEWDGDEIERAAAKWREIGRDNRTHHERGASMHAGSYDLSLTGNQAFQVWVEQWGRECLRVLKPGGYLLAFGGTRTFHRLTCALEDAGFEIRDSIGWNHLEPIFCRCDALPYTHGIQSQDMQGVRQDLDTCDTVSGRTEPDMLDGVLPSDSHLPAQEGTVGVHLPDVRETVSPPCFAPPQKQEDVLFPIMSKSDLRGATSEDRLSRTPRLDEEKPTECVGENARPAKSGVERRRNILQEKRKLYRRPLRKSAEVGNADGAQGRLCNGTPPSDGSDVRLSPETVGGRTPRGSQAGEQHADESFSMAVEWLPSGGGAWPGCPKCGKPLAPPLFQGPLAWNYGSGFPKSLDVSKAIDKATGAERVIVGTCKSAFGTETATGERVSRSKGGAGLWGGPNAKEVSLTGAPVTADAERWQGWGTALKPAWEPIILARKSLSEPTVAANVLKWGTGALNIDGCRIGENPGYKYAADRNGTTFHGQQGDRIKQTAEKKGAEFIESTKGRWPANLVLDEEAAAMLDEQSGERPTSLSLSASRGKRPSGFGNVGAERGDSVPNGPTYGDRGGASRFFYCAKVSRSEREAGLKDLESMRTRLHGSIKVRNIHPTVKPISLMRYLCRLVTPPNGVILDPFAGTFTTGIAAVLEGFDYVMIEREPKYVEIGLARLDYWIDKVISETPGDDDVDPR